MFELIDLRVAQEQAQTGTQLLWVGLHGQLSSSCPHDINDILCILTVSEFQGFTIEHHCMCLLGRYLEEPLRGSANAYVTYSNPFNHRCCNYEELSPVFCSKEVQASGELQLINSTREECILKASLNMELGENLSLYAFSLIPERPKKKNK